MTYWPQYYFQNLVMKYGVQAVVYWLSGITQKRVPRLGYLMKTPPGLVVLAPQAVGTSQVEEHHGASSRHTAGVAQRDLLPCCG